MRILLVCMKLKIDPVALAVAMRNDRGECIFFSLFIDARNSRRNRRAWRFLTVGEAIFSKLLNVGTARIDLGKIA